MHIDISSELSCTCQNAVLAAQELAEQGQIHVVDSRQLSTGGGLLALRGAKLRDGGMAAADIAAELRRLAPHSDTSFVLDTYRGRKDEVKTNFRGLQPLDQLLLLLFVLDTVLLVVVAIYAPQLTGSLGYSLWQFLR